MATNTQLARLPLQIPMSLNYEGTLNGLLDQLAQKTGVWWKFADGKAVFFRSESKTFYLPTIARSFKGSSTITTTSASVSGSSGSGGANVSGGANSSSGAESTSRYDVDLWKDIETTAKVVGKGAEVAINAAAGSITVTGSPAEVRHMETWVKTLSDQLSQQVQIDVNIYTVEVNSEENYSWNPSVIFKSAGNLGFNVTGIQTPAVIGGATPFNIGASVINSSNYAGSTAAMNALSSIGKVTEKLHQQAIAMNGQPTPVQLARQQSYLASSNSTTSANVGTTTSLTPGTFTVGFTAMFVPRIINGKIVLAMTMTNSTLVALKTVTSGSGASQASIQTPDIDTSTFQNTVTLTPGDALLLTSLTKENGSNQNTGIFSPFFYLLGGGFDSTAGKQIMAIVVTAKVL
jgi:type IVB pilus formation R64 PilN family outer membrane protein